MIQELFYYFYQTMYVSIHKTRNCNGMYMATLIANDNYYNYITNILDATRTTYIAGGFMHLGGYLKFTGGTYGGSSGKLCKMTI